MRIPRKIDLALKKRTRLASELQAACAEVDEFLLKHDIDPGPDSFLTGCLIYTEPATAEKSVRMAIDMKD